MTLHTVIQELRMTEAQAEQSVRKAEQTSAHLLHDANKKAEEDFDAFKARLEKSREKSLKTAEGHVAKEIKKISATGKRDLTKLANAAEGKRKQVREAVVRHLFP